MSIEQLFLESRGQPVVYKGQTICMVDRIDVAEDQVLKVTFEEIRSDWRQGVCLTVNGEFEVAGQVIQNSVVLWHDTSPTAIEVHVQARDGTCQIKNVWDIGDGVMQSWHNGAAMIVHRSMSTRRYKCNDGRDDEDFDDLVFTIEFVNPPERMN
jgi:hypothetical protein